MVHIKIKKQSLIALAAGIFHFVVFLFLSYFLAFKNVFRNAESTIFYILSMILCLALCILIWQVIFRFVQSLIQKNNRAKRFLLFGGIFFAVMFVFYMLTFPGIWSRDQLTILSCSQNFVTYGWQHVFTQVIYITGMFFFIKPSLIVLWQIIIITVIVGYFLTDISLLIEQKRGKKSKWVYLLLIPFFLPPTILHVLMALRLSIFSFIELLVFYEIISLKIKKERPTIAKLIILGICIAILSFWRSETIFYFVLLPVLLFLFSKKLFTKRLVCIFFASFLTMSVIMYVPQKLSLQKSSYDESIFAPGQNPTILRNITNYEIPYSISGFLTPLVALAKQEWKENGEYAPVLNKYFINPSLITEHNWSAPNCFWNGNVRFDLTNDELNELRSVYIKLVFKHFNIFLQERFTLFSKTNGFDPKINMVVLNPEHFESGTGVSESIFAPEVRIWYIRSLLFGAAYQTHVFPYQIVYNTVPILIFMLAMLIYAIMNIKKNKVYIIILLALLAVAAQTALLFIATPEPFFMYYLPIYIIGYTSVFTFFLVAPKIPPKEKPSSPQQNN